MCENERKLRKDQCDCVSKSVAASGLVVSYSSIYLYVHPFLPCLHLSVIPLFTYIHFYVGQRSCEQVWISASHICLYTFLHVQSCL